MSHQGDPPQPRPANETSPAADQAARPVHFWFEKQKLEGLAGESIAKALFHNGIRVLSHSVKYGRPRGIHCGRGRCVMCHVEVDGVTGVKSCVTPLAAGMRIRRQSYNPFYFPVMTSVMKRVPFPAGFYYRMFTRPRLVRNAFVGTIRRLAGVGKIDDRSPNPRELPPTPADLTRLRPRYDVVVVGAGVSGLSASLAAAETGADVLLVDEYKTMGGHSIGALADDALAAARADLVRRVEGARVTVALGTTAQAYYEPARILVGREGKAPGGGGGLRQVAAAAFVFATGAQDLTPLFENNDLPGVFGARALRLFLERDGLVPGRRAVVYGTGADMADAVELLRAWNIDVEAAVDASSGGPARPRGPEGLRRVTGATLVRAEGREWVSRAVFKTGGGDRTSLPCDLLCIAVPGQPSFELAQQAGFPFSLRATGGCTRDDLKVMVPTTDAVGDVEGARRFVVGGASGRSDWTDKIEHAADVGRRAAG